MKEPKRAKDNNQPAPWTKPPLPEYGDDDPNLTFAAVGRALSQWEHFEGYLGLIFGALVGDYSPASPAMRAYGAGTAFGGRLNMVKEASAAHFRIHPDNDLQKLIDTLRSNAGHWVGRRNEVAHGIVQPYYPKGRSERGSALGPSRHASKDHKLTGQEDDPPYSSVPTYAYTASELDGFARAFEKLAKEATALFLELDREQRARHRRG